MIARITALLIFNVFLGITGFSQEKIKIRINDTTFFEHDVMITKNDTLNGEKRAVYANDTSVIAYQKKYYEGHQTGFYKIFFPNGKIMETTVYMKGKKNGEYTLYAMEGGIIIKGGFTNDLKDGYWAFKKHKLFGKYKDGLKHGKWKWYQENGIYYVYKFNKGVLQSVSVKNAPAFPEHLIYP